MGDRSEEDAWNQRRQAVYQDALRWFWAADGSGPYQYYQGGTRQAGNSTWALSVVAVDLLSGGQLQGVLGQIRAAFDPALPFGGMRYPKYPEMSLLVYGLLDRGQHELAIALAQACVRDVVRAGTFSEYYSVDSPGAPQPQGVRPSCFGACMAIDFTLILNGVRGDQGAPVPVIGQA
jgi:hypothetical protein